MDEPSKTAVITGASRGIGKATAKKFLEAGWYVVGTSTCGSGWEQPNMTWVQLDLSAPESILKAVETIAKNDSIDVLIDNGGFLAERESDFGNEPIEMASLRKTLEINLIGTVDLTERLIPFIKTNGHIVMLGSRCGSLTEATETMSPAYSISKAALGMYARQLAGQLNGRKITVSIVDPGWVRTDMGGDEAPRTPEEAAQDVFDLATSAVETGQFWFKGKKRDW